jgi:hypothetical protein
MGQRGLQQAPSLGLRGMVRQWHPLTRIGFQIKQKLGMRVKVQNQFVSCLTNR